MRVRLSMAAFCALICTAILAAELEVKDEGEFAKVVSKDAKVEKLASGMKFLEGPVWVSGDGGYLLFSDIPAHQIKKWSAKDGLTTFRDPSNDTNGHYLTPAGELVSCEHKGRRISITHGIKDGKDGTVETLVDAFEGKKLSSPNDLAVMASGAVYFTDPPYGLPNDPNDKTKKLGKEQEKNGVYRFDPKTKEIKRVVDDFDMPNGICFSPDEKKVYIADSGKPKHVRVFEVKADGSLEGGAVFCKIDEGAPDGIRCDAEGRLYSSAKVGIQVFNPDGKLIGKILVPETPANLCFGGEDRKTLYITARTGLYGVKVLVAGAH